MVYQFVFGTSPDERFPVCVSRIDQSQHHLERRACEGRKGEQEGPHVASLADGSDSDAEEVAKDAPKIGARWGLPRFLASAHAPARDCRRNVVSFATVQKTCSRTRRQAAFRSQHGGILMAEEAWHEARLIPTSGINGAEEQERRATSALLAVLSAVKEFGRGFVQPFGAPSGTIECFIEVPFVLGERRLYPDGLIRVSRGARSWTALVEVKTGPNQLAAEQLENYLDIAREHGYAAVITISNEIPAVAGQHPTKVDKRKLKKVSLHHVSWSQVLAEAVMQKEFRGVADPDQAWILGELIRYLEHRKSGALEFDDMGEAWVGVRDQVAAGTLRSSDKGIAEVVARFDALLRFASLQLGRQLGTEVVPVLSRKEAADPILRAQALTHTLCATGELSGAIRIPGTVGHLVVTADLRAGKVTCHVDVDAPREGRATTRVNWLLRQLKNAPDATRVEAFVAHARGSQAAELLGVARENPGALVLDPTKELRSFRLAATSTLGTKRGRGRGSFIDSVLSAVNSFYADVLGSLRAWAAAPPKLRPVHAEPPELDETVPAAWASTDYSSQDGSEETGPEARSRNEHSHLSSVAAAAEHRAGIVVGMNGFTDSDADNPSDVPGLLEPVSSISTWRHWPRTNTTTWPSPPRYRRSRTRSDS